MPMESNMDTERDTNYFSNANAENSGIHFNAGQRTVDPKAPQAPFR